MPQRATSRGRRRHAAPTGWAVRQAGDPAGEDDSWCTCGAELSSCLGCGLVRCLACDPYLSDDCRWQP